MTISEALMDNSIWAQLSEGKKLSTEEIADKIGAGEEDVKDRLKIMRECGLIKSETQSHTEVGIKIVYFIV
jgi:predicted transcriptional regulator